MNEEDFQAQSRINRTPVQPEITVHKVLPAFSQPYDLSSLAGVPWGTGITPGIVQTIVNRLMHRLQTTPEKPKFDEWQAAVLNECMAVESCYAEGNPSQTLANLINWHVLTERSRGSIDQGLISARLEHANTQASALKKALELIALGDVKDPMKLAGEALVDLGIWGKVDSNEGDKNA